MAADSEVLKWLIDKAKSPEEIESRVLGIFSPPGYGKTVLASMIGEPTLIITDEMNGITSLKNHPELKGKVKAVPFRRHEITAQVVKLAESEQFVHDDGRPFDVCVLDTVSGQVAKEVQAIQKSGLTGAKGRLSPESKSQPDYGISEDRVTALMYEISNLTRMTVVLLFHTRIGDKLTPGDLTRPDVHAAAFRVVNKYSSVIAYLDIDKKEGRRLQVMPNGNGVSCKSRYRFPSEFVSPDEFVAHIRKWKEK